MEAGLTPTAPSEADPEHATHPAVEEEQVADSRVARARALSQGVVVWALAGLIFGGVGPGLVALTSANPGEFAGFIVGSELVGVVSGAVIGLIDWPRRLRVSTGWRVVLSGIIAGFLGPFWAGLAGAAGGVAFAASLLAMEGQPMGLGPASDALPTLGMMGAVFGVFVGTPAVVLFAMGRALTLSLGWPWWLPHAIAGLGIGLIGVWWLSPGVFPGVGL